jgi:hypothetical protein
MGIITRDYELDPWSGWDRKLYQQLWHCSHGCLDSSGRRRIALLVKCLSVGIMRRLLSCRAFIGFLRYSGAQFQI